MGVAHDFKAWLANRLPTVESWTDNLVFRFSKNPSSGRVQMHYKYMGQSPRYFGENHEHPVASFKALQRHAQHDPSLWKHTHGITMPEGLPEGQPGPATNIDFASKGTQENVPSDTGYPAIVQPHFAWWHVANLRHACRTTRERKCKADSILETCLRSIKVHLGAGDKFEEAAASWTKKMAELKAGHGAPNQLLWKPLIARAHQRGGAEVVHVPAVQNTERVVRENVPQVVHPGWSTKDKKRANEVSTTHVCTQADAWASSCHQVANAVREGLSEFSSDEIKKGNFVAVYACDDLENCGLPFWIGKVVQVQPHVDSGDDEDDGGGKVGEMHDVKVEEFRQQNSKRAAGRYEPNVVSGAKRRGKGTTTAKKVTNLIPLAQICHIFESLTSSKTIPAKEKDWIAFNCEVAARTRAFDISELAIQQLNEDCGFKTMPFAAHDDGQ